MLHAPLIYSIFYYFSHTSSAVSCRLDYLSNHITKPLTLPVLCGLLKFMRGTGTKKNWDGEEKKSGSNTLGQHAWETDDPGCGNRKNGEETIHLFLLSHKKTSNGIGWRPASKSSPLPILDSLHTQDFRGTGHKASMLSLSSLYVFLPVNIW